MKIFFEEYGMVIVVSILAFGMITFSNQFKDDFNETLETRWDSFISEGASN